MTDSLFEPKKVDGFTHESPVRAFTTFDVSGSYAIGKGFRPSMQHLPEYLNAMERKEGWSLIQILFGSTEPTMVFHRSALSTPYTPKLLSAAVKVAVGLRQVAADMRRPGIYGMDEFIDRINGYAAEIDGDIHQTLDQNSEVTSEIVQAQMNGDPIPPLIYWDEGTGNFWGQVSQRGQGQDFLEKWFSRRGEFPTSAVEEHQPTFMTVSNDPVNVGGLIFSDYVLRPDGDFEPMTFVTVPDIPLINRPENILVPVPPEDVPFVQTSELLGTTDVLASMIGADQAKIARSTPAEPERVFREDGSRVWPGRRSTPAEQERAYEIAQQMDAEEDHPPLHLAEAYHDVRGDPPTAEDCLKATAKAFGRRVEDDPVNPAHYAGTACAEIGERLTPNAYQVLKYNWRVGKKDELCVELGKSLWYLDREIALHPKGIKPIDNLPNHKWVNERTQGQSEHTKNVAAVLVSWARYGNVASLKALRKAIVSYMDENGGCVGYGRQQQP